MSDTTQHDPMRRSKMVPSHHHLPGLRWGARSKRPCKTCWCCSNCSESASRISDWLTLIRDIPALNLLASCCNCESYFLTSSWVTIKDSRIFDGASSLSSVGRSGIFRFNIWGAVEFWKLRSKCLLWLLCLGLCWVCDFASSSTSLVWSLCVESCIIDVTCL